MFKYIKPGIKLTLLLLWLLLCFCALWILRRANKDEHADRAVVICQKGVLKILGIRLSVTGEPVTQRPALLVSNHISYADVSLIGSILPVRFTPKKDIESWPFAGAMCKLYDVIFIDRSAGKVKVMQEKLRDALLQGKMVSLFPEATTGDGIHLLPFKSGFFSLAEEDFGDKNLTIQPLAITYTRIRKLPIDRTQWPDIAWYGDMDFMPHLFQMLALGPLDAEIVFLPPIEVTRETDRKQLAQQCQQAVEEAIEQVRHRKPPVLKPHASAKDAQALSIKS